MSTILALRFFAIATIVCCALNAGETSHPPAPLNRMDRRLNQSDLIAIVKVTTANYVRKAKLTENGLEVVDLYSYGRLLRLQVIEAYKSKLPQLPPKYIYFN